MLNPSEDIKIFIGLSPVDMRKSINGLSALIVDVFEDEPQSRHLFIFHNKIKDKVKIIFWDRNGFVLYYKRLEKGRFKFNKSPTEGSLEVTNEQLQWLLAGLDFQLMNEFNEIDYSKYY